MPRCWVVLYPMGGTGQVQVHFFSFYFMLEFYVDLCLFLC